MDFSYKGVPEGIKKVGKVLVYLIASMAVVGLGMWIKDQTVTWNDVRLAMELAAANLVFVFLQKWLSTAK